MSDAAQLAGVFDILANLDADVRDATRIDRIRLLEQVKSAVAAAQARETAAFAASQRAAQAAAGLRDIGKAIAAQVGLARRISPHAAARYVGWATILTTELPATFAELAAGRTSEWRAMLVARETAFLSREHRALVDAELAPLLESLGDRRTEAEARKLGYRLDPAGYVARTRQAENDRHVSLRPAPDAMALLTALLPVGQGVAAYAALSRAADAGRAAGDDRGRGQLMADTLVERLTGQPAARDVPVAVNLTISADSLFHDDGEPAHLDGYGPIPAGVARDLVSRPNAETPMWIRRLYTAPGTGELVAVDSRQRTFTPGQRRFVRLRDQWCRVPWCEAAIRHVDHINPHRRGGPTSLDQAQGLSEGCNYSKEAPGWNTQVVDTADAGHEVEITTPTGHRYRSRAPDPPRPRGTDSAA